jgi:hypothetical protein
MYSIREESRRYTFDDDYSLVNLVKRRPSGARNITEHDEKLRAHDRRRRRYDRAEEQSVHRGEIISRSGFGTE